ncbi:hypothetical protein SASPL_119551 [Salvia splendens]|uniref:WAT1-related protein n=1 Tax=Salvia splendens TaxID=180675 RepID=A0A8X8XSJ6_SALSN|nr:hypothetical protein SASPL_119551 [Salvia splendens]
MHVLFKKNTHYTHQRGKLYQIIDGLKPLMMMVTVQIALAGVNIIYKLVANTGMSLPILIAYRFLFASAAIVPLALIFERSFLLE